MFARTFARLPFRRYLHTTSATYRRADHSKWALYLAAPTAAVATWYTMRELALDSPGNPTSKSPVNRPAAKNPVAQPEPPLADDAAPAFDSTPPASERKTAATDVEASDGPPSEDGAPQSSGSGGKGGAFNPETGEINWDCPCLGGMAHGPCGPEFREAFSCFVFSEDEPKGINCVEKFQAMQTCFRAHPEVYADEIMNDDDDEEATNAAPAEPSSPDVPPSESPNKQPITENASLDAPGPKSQLDVGRSPS